ncbi:MAG: sulfatase-like hydrolase/transferase [Bryobacterales bacterium]|nr:sulfatase-like hydrolase/transferase [Bryobacterales bacterium]
MTRRQFAGAAAGLAAAQTSPRWNVLMITHDQQRADCLGCYGNPVIRTPNIDRLASEGVRFDQHYVQTPQCVPSRVSLATGRYPHVHRTPTNLYRLPDHEQTLARVLNGHGYHTATVGELPFAPRRYLGGFQQLVAGGKEHDAVLAKDGWHGGAIPDANRRRLEEFRRLSQEQFQASAVPWPEELDETAVFADHARQYLRANRERPFFLHVNLRRPHHPFDPPAPFDRMYEGAAFPASHARRGEMDRKPPGHGKALQSSVGFDLTKMTPKDLDRVKAFYYGMISLNDKYVGQILKELQGLGLAERTVVVFNADHGEMLGDHGLLFKGGYMYDEVLRTPLLIRAPGKVAAGVVDGGLCEEIDVLPTVLGLLELPLPAGVQGRPLIRPEGRREQKGAVFAEFPTIHAVRTSEWKLVRYGRARLGEFYDLKNDPHELDNLWDDAGYAKRRGDVEGVLFDWFVTSQDPLRAPVVDG